MVLFRPRRDRQGRDRWLPHKMLLFAIGAAMAVIGMAFELSWLVMAAIVVLSVGAGLALLRRGARTDVPED